MLAVRLGMECVVTVMSTLLLVHGVHGARALNHVQTLKETSAVYVIQDIRVGDLILSCEWKNGSNFFFRFLEGDTFIF